MSRIANVARGCMLVVGLSVHLSITAWEQSLCAAYKQRMLQIINSYNIVKHRADKGSTGFGGCGLCVVIDGKSE